MKPFIWSFFEKLEAKSIVFHLKLINPSILLSQPRFLVSHCTISIVPTETSPPGGTKCSMTLEE
jgi:hypothetical protein